MTNKEMTNDKKVNYFKTLAKTYHFKLSCILKIIERNFLMLHVIYFMLAFLCVVKY